MRTMTTGLAIVALSGLTAGVGCTAVTNSERLALNEVTEAGYAEDAVQRKDPTAAALLNILPGIGNFYLATGTQYSEHVWIGVTNLLFWPLSIVWGIPEAAVDAGNINRKETAFTWRAGGAAAVERRVAQLEAGEPSELPSSPPGE